MRIAIVLISLMVVTACSRKPDVYIVTPGAVTPAAEVPAGS